MTEQSVPEKDKIEIKKLTRDIALKIEAWQKLPNKDGKLGENKTGTPIYISSGQSLKDVSKSERSVFISYVPEVSILPETHTITHLMPTIKDTYYTSTLVFHGAEPPMLETIIYSPNEEPRKDNRTANKGDLYLFDNLLPAPPTE